MAEPKGRCDFVIVGGGSAGCALANRLSADPGTSVLVLEAGRMDWRWDVFIHMPAALTYPIGSRFYDWRYESEPEPHMGGRRVYHARGKVLGGSSSINGMIFQRGNPMDYDRWSAAPGMAGWDYAHCLPYFKRMENRLAGGDDWRGDNGPLRLETGPARNPLFDAWLAAGPQAGFHRTDDVNGYQQEGFAVFDKNVVRGRRLSAARAYLHPVLDRPNLTVTTRVQVNRILFSGTRAIGVKYRRGRRADVVKAGEVVSCGGAFNSPQLLQLSGIGDPGHLGGLGIDTVADLPGVGQNLQDHLEVYIQYACKEPVSMQPQLATWRMPIIGLQWLARRGPAATNHFEAGAFVRSNDHVEYPNLMLHFLPLAIRYDGSSPTAGHGYQVHIGPMYSDVRGSVTITSDRPRRASRDPVQLSVHRERPARVARGRADRQRHLESASVRALQRRRAVARPRGRNRRGNPRLGGPRRRDRAASLVYRPHGRRRSVGRRSDVDAGPRRRRTSSGRCLRHARHHQRQHLRPHDDDRRAGRRHDPRQRAAPTRPGGGLSGPRRGTVRHVSAQPNLLLVMADQMAAQTAASAPTTMHRSSCRASRPSPITSTVSPAAARRTASRRSLVGASLSMLASDRSQSMAAVLAAVRSARSSSVGQPSIGQ